MWNLKVGEICKLVKSDKSEIGWNLKIGEICNLVESDSLLIAFITWNSNLVPWLEGLCTSNPCSNSGDDGKTMGTMEKSGRATGESEWPQNFQVKLCEISESWWNSQVGEIWQKWDWVKSESEWNLQVGEICNSGDAGFRQISGRAHRWEWPQNHQMKLGEIWNLVKSTSRWNLQVDEMGKRSWWKRNLLVGSICNWVKQQKENGENEIYASGWKSASGWKKTWAKTTHLKKEVGENVKYREKRSALRIWLTYIYIYIYNWQNKTLFIQIKLIVQHSGLARRHGRTICCQIKFNESDLRTQICCSHVHELLCLRHSVENSKAREFAWCCGANQLSNFCNKLRSKLYNFRFVGPLSFRCNMQHHVNFDVCSDSAAG